MLHAHLHINKFNSPCAQIAAMALLLFCGQTLHAQAGSRGSGAGGPSGPQPTAPVVRQRRPQFGPTGPQVLVKEIRITGNRNVRESRIRSYVQSRVDRAFDPEVVEQDVRAITTTGLFHDVRTFTREVPGGIAITFEVFERPIIGYIKVIGNKAYSDEYLAEKSGLKVGEPLNIYSTNTAATRMQDFYHSKGFRRTIVTVLEGTQSNDRGVAFSVHEGPKERIWGVEFIGNEIVSDGRLKTQIKSKPAMFKYGLFRGSVNPQQIDEDVQRITAYYRQLGYFHARVGREIRMSDDRQWAQLAFVIDEGPRYSVRHVSFLGNEKFSDKDLEGMLQLKDGEEYHMARMNTDVRALRDHYGSKGFIFADVQADPRFFEEPGQLDLVYNINEGEQYRIGEIRVHIDGANPHTRRSVVYNRLSFAPGDIIDSRQIRDSERRLKFSQLFRSDPGRGVAPRIVVRPPDNDAPSQIANTPLGPRRSAGGSTYRGQSPEYDLHEVKKVNVDVYVPKMQPRRLPPTQ